MKYSYLLIALLFLGFALYPVAIHAEDIKPPKGIPEAAWIGISENYGFVITHASGKALKDLSEHEAKEYLKTGQYSKVFNSVSGYFLIKKKDKWFRIVEKEGASAKLHLID